MSRWFRYGLLALLCSLSLRCTSEEVFAPTQVLLRIDMADQESRDDLGLLRVALFSEKESGWQMGSAGAYTLPLTWPVELPVLPRTRDDIERPFEVVVHALKGDEVFAQTRAVTRFLENRRLILSLWLERCPGSASDALCSSDDCHGAECKVCRRGSCVPVRETDPKSLTEWSDNAKTPPPDGDASSVDASGKDAARTDAALRDGGAIDEAGAVESDASVAEDGGVIPAPDAGPPEPVEGMCDVADALRCVNAGSRDRESCQGGRWMPTTPCAEGEACDGEATPAGSCRKLSPVCVGAPASAVCDRETLVSCDGKGSETQRTPCDSPAHCERGKTAGTCATCLAGEHRCTGAALEVCKADGQGFEPKQTCASAALCNAAAGSCAMGCTAGAKTCVGDELRACSADLTGFVREETCDPGLCDNAGKQCDECVPTAKTCQGDNVLTCSTDGQMWTSRACAAPRSICTGNGNCVECTATRACPASTMPCYTNTCDVASGTCELVARPSGTSCNSSGFCDGMGKCGVCRNGDTQQCGSDEGECSFGTRTCSGGAWGNCTGGVSSKAETCNGRDDDCDGVDDDSAPCPAGQTCSGGRCQTLCGNRVKEASEACDPTAPGWNTFTCTNDCTAVRELYPGCRVGEIGGTPGPDCASNEICEAFGEFAMPSCVPVRSSARQCPAIRDYTWVLGGATGTMCLLPCTVGRNECPAPVSNCIPNDFLMDGSGWCVRH